jgi:hypothetical protein
MSVVIKSYKVISIQKRCVIYELKAEDISNGYKYEQKIQQEIAMTGMPKSLTAISLMSNFFVKISESRNMVRCISHSFIEARLLIQANYVAQA